MRKMRSRNTLKVNRAEMGPWVYMIQNNTLKKNFFLEKEYFLLIAFPLYNFSAWHVVGALKHLFSIWTRRQQTLTIKMKVENFFSFSGREVSVAATHFCSYSVKAGPDNVNKRACLCSSQTLFMNSRVWVSCNFCIMKYSSSFDFSPQSFKM